VLLIIFITTALVAFLVTIGVLPKLIRFNTAHGIVGRDINKMYKHKIPEMGGLAVVIGSMTGIVILLLLVLFTDLIEIEDMPLLLASILAIAGAGIIGYVDDRFHMRQRVKAVLPFLFAIPLGLLVDFTTIRLPLAGAVDFGIWMVLIIPFGITAAANSANMLEGFNGLGCGLGIVMSTTLILVAWINGNPIALVLLVPLLASLAAFYFFNRFPSRIFPGDTMTLFMGATIAVAAILGGMKEIGAVLFIPMIVEFFLKLRRRFTTESFGKLDKFGYLRYYGPVTSLTHILLKLRRFKEWQVSAMFWGLEFAIAVSMLGFMFIAD
jgi:UDP-N-acetylglucosamine--dolichyl-phosphate N-acetylglucosaminephosphotransferase